jgi:hypothetical protein
MKKIKSNQKLRVIVDGVGLHGTKKMFLDNLFATTYHRDAFVLTIGDMEHEGVKGIGQNIQVGSGGKIVSIQIDLLD